MKYKLFSVLFGFVFTTLSHSVDRDLSNNDRYINRSLTPSVEISFPDAKKIKSESRNPNQIGYRRDIPKQKIINLNSGGFLWNKNQNGESVGIIHVNSPNALAIRLGLNVEKLSSRSKIYFYSINNVDSPVRMITGSQVTAIIAQDNKASGNKKEFPGIYWSPTITGESVAVEVHVPGDVSTENIKLSISVISHIDKGLGDYLLSGSCHVNAVCGSNLQTKVAKSVAHMQFVEDGNSYMCTGTLIEDKDESTRRNFFLTANHCISSQKSASTLETRWLYMSQSCGFTTGLSQSVLLSHPLGSVIRFTTEETDTTLLELHGKVPDGVTYSQWSTKSPYTTQSVFGLHHPKGDSMKLSSGEVLPGCLNHNWSKYVECNSSKARYTGILWNEGVTAKGSSGSALFNKSGQIIGQLWGGESSCQTYTDESGFQLGPDKPDIYGLFSAALKLGMSQYLNSSEPIARKELVDVVEFYNSSLNHYFITANDGEAQGIDQGSAGTGWRRTGKTFKAWLSPTSDSTEVCRFYGAEPNSHFYTLAGPECEATKASPGWAWESGNKFYVMQAGAKGCPSGSQAVHRLYNNRFSSNDSNHRYTVEMNVVAQMKSQSWIHEGVVFCTAK